MDNWVVSTLSIMLLWTFMYDFLCENIFSTFLGIYLEWNSSTLTVCLIFWSFVSHRGCTIFHSYQQCMRILISPPPHPINNFIVTVLSYSSLIHFELIFIYGMRQGSSFPSSVCWQDNVLCLGTVIKNQMTIDVQVYFWTLNYIPLFHIPIFMPH